MPSLRNLSKSHRHAVATLARAWVRSKTDTHRVSPSDDGRYGKTRLRLLTLAAGLAASTAFAVAPASAQVRTKKPDRGTYQSPRIENPMRREATAQPEQREAAEDAPKLAEFLRASDLQESSTSRSGVRQAAAVVKKPKRALVDVPLTYAPSDSSDKKAERTTRRTAGKRSSKLRQVAHQDVRLISPEQSKIVDSGTLAAPIRDEPIRSAPIQHEAVGSAVTYEPSGVILDGGCDSCLDCDSCDSMGCDSMGCCQSSWWRRWSNGSLSMNQDQWFGSVELLLMWRKGDHLPPLVTTGPDTDPDTAGELGQPGTTILVGPGNAVLKDMTAGGRFTVGTFLDRHQCRSLVLRGWFAGEEKFGFSANDTTVPVIARPFLNVSDNQAAAQDTQLVAFPNRASGSIRVNATSNVYGGDLSVRQFAYCRYGATIDVLYGYQHMRLKENLLIEAPGTTSLDAGFAPVGSVIAVTDSFRTESEFHGAQIGMASRYREGCWSFNSLLKLGFGSLRRQATLSGLTVTSNGGNTAVDNQGLLVRNTNSGVTKDDTFGWIPELDLSLSWQKYPCFDLTFGYHIIAMTDALQASGAIDPNLAVNLSTPPTGQQRPAANLRYRTYYVQGLHFGLSYIY